MGANDPGETAHARLICHPSHEEKPLHRKRLPRLEIVPLRNLILHEDVEHHRVDRIVERLREDGHLKNPPIVGRNHTRRKLIVLDGASRVTAARYLGFPHLIVQVLDYPSPDIVLEPWHHLVVGMSFDNLVEQVAEIGGISLERVTWAQASTMLDHRKVVACLRSPARQPIVIKLVDPTRTGLRPVRELTRIYATDPGLHRVREDQVVFPSEWLGEERVFVLFPKFRQEDIVEFALRHQDRLPMGITRHAVPNRALRVFYPIRQLRSTRPLAEKREHLRRFLETKWEEGSIRHYPETTTLYDE